MLLRETLEKLESNFLGGFLVGGAVGAGWPYPLLVGDLFNFFTTYSEGFKSISAGAECQYPTSQLATTHGTMGFSSNCCLESEPLHPLLLFQPVNAVNA